MPKNKHAEDGVLPRDEECDGQGQEEPEDSGADPRHENPKDLEREVDHLLLPPLQP